MNGVGKTATDMRTASRPTFFYGSAREGMQDLLSSTLPRERAGVLMPGFIGWSPREGSGVHDPVQALGLQAGFYDLHQDLGVDVDSVRAMAATGDFHVLVVIHYFGRTELRTAELREIADEHGMVLVEDLAHGFFTALTGGAAGRYGDANLYSLHKMLPVPSGGMVSYASDRLVGAQRSTAPELAATVLSFDWHQIARRRRDTFTALTRLLRELPSCGTAFTLMWPNLSEGDVPQTLPIVVQGPQRDAVYAAMNAQGFGVVSLYHTLIEDVRTEYSSLVHLSGHILNLPVHQDVRADDLGPLVRALDDCLAAR